MERTIEQIRQDLAQGKPVTSADLKMLTKATEKHEAESAKKLAMEKATTIVSDIKESLETAGLDASVPLAIYLNGGDVEVFVGYRKGSSDHFDMKQTSKGITGIAFNTTDRKFVAAYEPVA